MGKREFNLQSDGFFLVSNKLTLVQPLELVNLDDFIQK